MILSSSIFAFAEGYPDGLFTKKHRSRAVNKMQL